jgi:hypothetical protein
MWRQDHGRRYKFAGDITGFAPRCRHTQKADGEGIKHPTVSQQITTFRPDSTFVPENASDFWNKDVQQAWLDIVPGMYSVTGNILTGS